MSVHFVNCAGRTPNLKPSEKLVLLCLAENANQKDAIAFPGMDGLRLWSGLSENRVYEVLRVLVELRLIEQVGRGHRGKAAEFVVFPYGCCVAHGREAPDPSWSNEPVETTAHRGLSEEKPTVSDEKAHDLDPHSPRHIVPPPNTPRRSPLVVSTYLGEPEDASSATLKVVNS